MYMTVKRVYNEFIRIGGTKFALEMHKRFEGEFVSVAYRKSKFYKAMEELLDSDVADAFFEKYHKRISIYVGKIDRLFMDKRNIKIQQEYASGIDYRAIAKKYGLSAPYVRRMVNHHPIRDRRLKLEKERQKNKVMSENE